MIFALIFWFGHAESPQEVPSLDAVRKAFKENLSRMANRRVKYVRVTQSGEPKSVFPPLDSPERMQVEEVFSNGETSYSGRYYRHSTSFQSGSVGGESIEGWDGRSRTSLQTRPINGKLNTKVDVRDSRGGTLHSELWVFEMRMRTLMEEEGIPQLGIRSSIKPSPLGGGLVELNPRVDDRSPDQERYTLDPKKNYWPIRYVLESRSPDGKVVKSSHVVGEFFSDPMFPYPKRVALFNHSREFKTLYYTAQSAEFPKKFEDAAFVVAIPDGAAVTDNVARKRYRQGSSEATPFGERLKPGFLDALIDLRTGDWLYYGGFVIGVVAAAVVFAFFFMRRSK